MLELYRVMLRRYLELVCLAHKVWHIFCRLVLAPTTRRTQHGCV